MAKKISLKESFTINAPVKTVWQALTDPKMIKEYFFGVETSGNWIEGHTFFL